MMVVSHQHDGMLEAARIVQACCPGSFEAIAARLLRVLDLMGDVACQEQREQLAWAMLCSACRLDPDVKVTCQ